MDNDISRYTVSESESDNNDLGLLTEIQDNLSEIDAEPSLELDISHLSNLGSDLESGKSSPNPLSRDPSTPGLFSL